MATSLIVYMVTVAKECCAIQSGTERSRQKDVFQWGSEPNLARRFKVSRHPEML